MRAFIGWRSSVLGWSSIGDSSAGGTLRYNGTKVPVMPSRRKPAIIRRKASDPELAMTAKRSPPHPAPREVERIQTGVRLEKRLLKVLKGLAEYLDLSLGDLLEGIALHALVNTPPFKRLTLENIRQLRPGHVSVP